MVLNKIQRKMQRKTNVLLSKIQRKTQRKTMGFWAKYKGKYKGKAGKAARLHGWIMINKIIISKIEHFLFY